jgi:SOS-response transcriptional repressor LexA
MNWRRIDNMIASRCIKEIQQDIKEGRKKASEIVQIPFISEQQASEFYDAWQAYFMDRMDMEQHRVGWRNTNTPDSASELDYDLKFYKLFLSK